MSHLLDDPQGLRAIWLLEDDGAEAIIHPKLGDLPVRQIGHLGQVILKEKRILLSIKAVTDKSSSSKIAKSIR